MSEERSRVIAEMQEKVYFDNKEKGWHDVQRSFGDLVALLHSEVSEMLEAFRDWGINDATNLKCLVCHGDGVPHVCKPEGVGSEMADVLIRLLDMSARYGVNLAAEYDRKMAYNRTRPYRHGGKAL